MLDGRGRQLAPGETFDRFRLVEQLGAGGMGSVWLVHDPRLDREVALKLMKAETSPRNRQRFPQEARAIARLKHPNVVTVHEFGLHEDQPYLVMDRIVGRGLSDFRRAAGRDAFLRALHQVALGVQHAHDHGVCHRDLKPANILVDEQGAAVITDFGLALLNEPEDERLTQTGQVLGTPLYMAPEQLAGDRDRVGPAADLWALGVILYEGLTDEPPFRGGTYVELLTRVSTAEPRPPSTLDPSLPRDADLLCARALHKHPDQRYPSAAEFAADVEKLRRGEPLPWRRLNASERLGLALRKGGPLIGAVLLASVVGLVSAWLARTAEQPERRPGPQPPIEEPSRPPLPPVAPVTEQPTPELPVTEHPARLAYSRNLLRNPGFELGPRSLASWSARGVTPNRVRRWSQFHSVAFSDKGGALRQRVLDDLPPGVTRYRVGGMFRANASSQPIRMFLEWTEAGAKQGAEVRRQVGQEWQFVSWTAELPSNAQGVTLVVRASDVLADAFELRGVRTASRPDLEPFVWRDPVGAEVALPSGASSEQRTERLGFALDRARSGLELLPVAPAGTRSFADSGELSPQWERLTSAIDALLTPPGSTPQQSWLGVPRGPLCQRIRNGKLIRENWTLELRYRPGYKAHEAPTRQDGTHLVVVRDLPAEEDPGGVQLATQDVARIRNKTYTFAFEARATSNPPHRIQVTGLDGAGGDAQTIWLSARWRLYLCSVQAQTTSQRPLTIDVGSQVGGVELRRLRWVQGTSNVFYRVFEHGVVALNLAPRPWRGNRLPKHLKLRLPANGRSHVVPGGEAHFYAFANPR